MNEVKNLLADQHQFSSQLNEFQVPISVITTPTLILTTDFTMVAANEARLQVTGTKLEQIIGRNIFDVFPDNPADPAAEGVRNLRASLTRVLRDKVPDKMAVQKYDIPIPGTDPVQFEERFWSPVNIPVIDHRGDVAYILHQVEDVTANVRIQDNHALMASEIYNRTEEVRSVNVALKLAKEELERKVAERTEQLLKAKESAEAANRMKSAFLANMSHEIRTPLSAIIGFTDLLREGGLNEAEREQFLETILRSGKALTRLIDDILDLAKVEAGRLDVEMVDFSFFEVVSDAVEICREKARQKNIELTLEIAKGMPARICSDPTRLRQILINLIGNAVKFTDFGRVQVYVRTAPIGPGLFQFVVDIKDTGIGLSEEQRKNLFKPFAQADNTTTRKYGGTGLGLVLSKRLSEALGGSISITESVPGKGSTFTLTFTARQAGAVTVEEKIRSSLAEVADFSLKDIRILAVDDSPENLLLIRSLLVKNGAIVDTAEDGKAAVEKATSGNYDIILMDIQMPKMDGYQSKKALDEHHCTQPVVAVTAHAMSEEREKTQIAGFAAHLTKPLNGRELVATIDHLVKDSKHIQNQHSIRIH